MGNVGDALAGGKKKLADFDGETITLINFDEHEGQHGSYLALQIEHDGEAYTCTSGGVPAEQAQTLSAQGLLPAQLKVVLFKSSYGGTWPRFEEA